MEGATEGAGPVKSTAAGIGANESEIPALRLDFVFFLPALSLSTLPVSTCLSLTLGLSSLASGTYVFGGEFTRFFLFVTGQSVD
jgi:hypothetical protein